MILGRLAIALLVILCACDGTGPDPEPGATTSALATQNGSNLNGSNLNGSNLNGSNLNGGDPGATLAAVAFAGAELGGAALDRTWLEGSMLAAEREGRTYAGTELREAELQAVAADGRAVKVKLADAVLDADGTWRYRVAHRTEDGSWVPVCPGDRLAVAVAGRWDYRRGVPGGGAKLADPAVFTFGCEGGAIDKCVRAGYRPWESVNGISLDAHHQACVRLIRADYCGDGTSHTSEGRWVNLYDALGIQQDDRSWLMEAEWTPAGARCVALLSRSLLGALCNDSLYALGCGATTHFATGTLLMSETPSSVLNTTLF